MQGLLALSRFAIRYSLVNYSCNPLFNYYIFCLCFFFFFRKIINIHNFIFVVYFSLVLSLRSPQQLFQRRRFLHSFLCKIPQCMLSFKTKFFLRSFSNFVFFYLKRHETDRFFPFHNYLYKSFLCHTKNLNLTNFLC